MDTENRIWLVKEYTGFIIELTQALANLTDGIEIETTMENGEPTGDPLVNVSEQLIKVRNLALTIEDYVERMREDKK